MARSALVGLFLLAALVVAFPAPRRESVQPSALSGVGGETDRALGGASDGSARDTVATAERTVVGHGPDDGSESSPVAGAPSPSSANFSARPSRSLPPVAASSGKPLATVRPTAKSSKAPQRVVRKPPAVQSKYGVPWLTAQGIASHMGSGFPPSYLALPHGPGWRARICGAGGCVTMTSNDAGPALYLQRQGRVADLSVAVFERVCGVPASMGLCPVSVTILGHV